MATEMNIIKRLRGSSPKFFRYLIRIALVIAAIGTAICSCSQAGVFFPDLILRIAEYMLATGTVATIVSKLPIEEFPADNIKNSDASGVGESYMAGIEKKNDTSGK